MRWERGAETAPHSVPTGMGITSPNPEMVKKCVPWPIGLGMWRKVPTVCVTGKGMEARA